MPRTRPITATRGGTIAIAIGVTVLTIIVVALAIAALRQSRPTDPGATIDPAPTFSYPARTGTPTPSPTPTPPVNLGARADARAAGAGERFLSIGAEAAWRAVAGACGGPAPLIERSTDDGATWSDVTPFYRDITQVRSLTSFGGRNATAVVDVGTACAAATMRTYTDGRFWEGYPDIFAVDTYALPGDAAVIVDGATHATPCTAPRGLRTAGGVTALVCDGTAYRLDGDSWAALASGARAVAIGDGDVVVARQDADCEGILLTSYRASDDGDDLGCLAADTTGEIAVDVTDAIATVWAGDALLRIND